MEQAVDEVLERRAEVTARRRWPSLVFSLALHLGLAAVAVLAPVLAARGRQPIEYVAVQIVPAQALGVEDPEPARPQQEATPAAAAPRMTAEVEEEPEPAAAEPPRQPRPEPRREPARSEPRAPADSRERSAPPPAGRDQGGTGPPGAGTRRGSPEGSPQGTAAFGAAVAGIDNPDFTYGYYIDQMLAMIRAQWVRPPLGDEVEAMVHFRIARDGALSDIRIVASSGYNQFDLGALRAVQGSAPLPPLPSAYRRDSLGVNLIFH